MRDKSLLFDSFQVALNVGEHAFALIFGWNTFVALALQSIMTLVVADEKGLNLKIREQVNIKICRFLEERSMFSIFCGVDLYEIC